jgi:hypothetical protein
MNDIKFELLENSENYYPMFGDIRGKYPESHYLVGDKKTVTGKWNIDRYLIFIHNDISFQIDTQDDGIDVQLSRNLYRCLLDSGYKKIEFGDVPTGISVALPVVIGDLTFADPLGSTIADCDTFVLTDDSMLSDSIVFNSGGTSVDLSDLQERVEKLEEIIKNNNI